MSSEQRSRGLLFVVPAPSGTGTPTVAERLVQIFPDVGLSRSYTSRVMRSGEKDGVDYNFITRERFDAMIADDAFLEWADVFGNLYGTGKAETESELAAGRDLVLVIDVQGARQVRSHGANAIGIFVLPPSFEALERRLRGRSKDSEEAIRKRLVTARREIRAVAEYEYVIVNDELDACVDRLRSIVLAERARPRVMAPTVARIVGSFTGKEQV